jgi:trans-2-enoyl-CoA reductase
MIIYKINDIEFTTDFKLKSVIDKIEHSICDVLLNITTLDGNKQVLNLTGFEYTDVWYDEDITNWVQIKLKEYKDTSGFYKYVEEEQG